MPVLPPGSHRDLVDPYAQKKPAQTILLALILAAVLVLALWKFGVLEWLAPGWLPEPPG